MWQPENFKSHMWRAFVAYNIYIFDSSKLENKAKKNEFQ